MLGLPHCFIYWRVFRNVKPSGSDAEKRPSWMNHLFQWTIASPARNAHRLKDEAVRPVAAALVSGRPVLEFSVEQQPASMPIYRLACSACR